MTSNDTSPDPHPYVGMWVTADGFIRQELRPDGRYDEARGNRRSAYTGSYTVIGNHIDYVDDTGFTATGDVRDGVLFHEHLVLYREGDEHTRREARP
ncbi:Atu4866 domain-containing protein [Streptomyces sp. NPDC056468]|uniref:Atu4866 domain-containing protein n=1 Tax=Streptomyces sp. NPDC056468 TaxID=3345830 RepID=UPI0036A17714